LITASHNEEYSHRLGLDESSRIYIIGSEGATDPELYAQLVGSNV